MDLKVEYVAKLARIELKDEEKEKFSKDLNKVLDYFRELQEVDTEGVLPMTGGTFLYNVFREDKVVGHDEAGKGAKQFPEREQEFLKVPKVFE